MTQGDIELASGLFVLVGLVGIVLPVLPGLVLVWAGIALWALKVSVTGGWLVLAVATVLLVAGTSLQYSLPGRRLRASGVPTRTTAAGAALGVVGFFVVPVIGLFGGFVLGVYLAERSRLGSHQRAWPSTLAALRVVALSVGIELATGLAMTVTWVAGLATVAG